MTMLEKAALAAGAASMVVFLIAAARGKSLSLPVSLAGFALPASALILRAFDAGRPPWGTLYETVAILGALAALASAYAAYKKYPKGFIMAIGGLSFLLTGASCLLWDDVSTLNEALHSPWLLIHVPVIILSYGAFMVSAAAAAGVIALKFKPGADDGAYGKLDALSSRAAYAGLILLIPGIVMGALWANTAWGSYWSWDPKETWSLITAVIYLAYAIARSRGMKGEDAAYVSLMGFISVIITYIGVSYVIPGLHSYV